jgi:RNA polymerase sigma-70 factor (ECF subfamily)
MNLENLISQCLNNDRQAQRQLYESYKDALYTIVYRIVCDFDLANDLLQETFIDAFKSLGSLKEKKFFYSWIKKILVRKVFAYLKNNKDTDDISTVEYKLADHSNPLDIDYIEHAIQKLPFKSRTVFVMAEIEGFAHKEIAEALEISVGTSKSQLNYAKTKLKLLLTEYLVD